MIRRLVPLVGFGLFLMVSSTAMDLIGVLLPVGLILAGVLGAGMVYAVRTTPSSPRPSGWYRRQERRTVADEAPDELPV